MPKIIFRDFSIQHIACLKPIYNEMMKQGFDCELQYLDVPREKNTNAFIRKHMNDPFDLLMTCSASRIPFVPSDMPVPPQKDFAREKRKNAIFMSHGVGGEEAPYYDHLEFKCNFLIGQFWIDIFSDPNLVIYQLKCKHCGGVVTDAKTADRFEHWVKPADTLYNQQRDWYCFRHKKRYYSKSIFDHVEIIEKHYGLSNLHLIGYPKLDLLAKPERHKIASELANKIDLPFDKTVLYAPTLKRLDSFDDTVMQLLKIMETLDVNLVIKTHCDDEDEQHQPRLYHQAKRKAEEMKNVRWIGGTFSDITPLYLISDVAVSACSGCLREFMLTDRPSIQLTNITDKARQKFYYEGCVQSNLHDLRKNLLHAIFVPEWKHEERQEQVKQLFHQPDGQATERAVNAVKKIMEW